MRDFAAERSRAFSSSSSSSSWTNCWSGRAVDRRLYAPRFVPRGAARSPRASEDPLLSASIVLLCSLPSFLRTRLVSHSRSTSGSRESTTTISERARREALATGGTRIGGCCWWRGAADESSGGGIATTADSGSVRAGCVHTPGYDRDEQPYERTLASERNGGAEERRSRGEKRTRRRERSEQRETRGVEVQRRRNGSMQPARKRRGTATGCNRSLCSLSTCVYTCVYTCVCVLVARGPWPVARSCASEDAPTATGEKPSGSLSLSTVIGPFNHPLRLLSSYHRPTFSFLSPRRLFLSRALPSTTRKTRIPSTLQASIPSRLSPSFEYLVARERCTFSTP